jgi:peptide deformylase
MEKIGLKIRLFGNSCLRKKTKEIKEVKQHHRDILSEMARLMYENGGIGLAAPQVNVNECMIIVDIGSGLYKLINPKIIKRSGSQVNEEGCLSIPGVCIKVKRAKDILLKAKDEEGNPLNIEADGLFACVLQHEIDHLSGKLIIDRASFLEKIKIKKKLAEIRLKEKNEKLSQSEAKSCQLQL